MFRGCRGAKDDYHAKLGARAEPQPFEFGESKGISGRGPWLGARRVSGSQSATDKQKSKVLGA